MLQNKGGRRGRSDNQILGSTGFLSLVKVRRALVPPKWRVKDTRLHRTVLGNGISCSRAWINLQKTTLPFCNVAMGFLQFLPAAPLSFFPFLEHERQNTWFPLNTRATTSDAQNYWFQQLFRALQPVRSFTHFTECQDYKRTDWKMAFHVVVEGMGNAKSEKQTYSPKLL